jgi:hypothetical protein
LIKEEQSVNKKASSVVFRKPADVEAYVEKETETTQFLTNQQSLNYNHKEILLQLNRIKRK